ncbi:MAG TPA: carbohydrate ABC transporter permease [Opitutaceae bacterium]|jgi:multiple sugar transport system permease protein
MKPRTRTGKAVATALLLLFSAAFVAPFVWLVSTSLKPIEQTLSLPISFIPKAYYAVLDGRRMEVTLDFQVTQPGAVVRILAGDDAGKLGYVSRKELAARPGGFQVIHDVDAGSWHVSQRFDHGPSERAPDPLWDVLPRRQIGSQVRFRWRNYPRALAALGGDSSSGPNRATFWTFLGNSLTVAILGVIGTVISNAIVAYGFSRLKWKGRDAFFALTLATMMVPFPVLMVPLYGIFKAFHMIGTLMPLWLPTWFGSAFNIFLMRQFFRTIPEELSEAARIDGCSEWRIFWRIIVPLSTPVLVVAALFHFIFAWNDFLAPLLYLTRKDTYTLAIALQSYQSQNGGVQWHYLMAASAVTILPVIVLFLFAQKSFIRGIATTGSKG